MEWPASLHPSQQSSFSTRHRNRESSYGDGILQVSKDGINSACQSGNIVLNNLIQAEYDAWKAFENEVGTWTAFTFPFLDDFTGNVDAKWRIKGDVSVVFASGNIYSVTVPIERIFGV